MSVNWTDEDRKGFTHCVECVKRGKSCPGWRQPTGGCAKGSTKEDK